MKMSPAQRWSLIASILIVGCIYFLVPIAKQEKQKADNQPTSPENVPLIEGYSTDTILNMSRSRLLPAQAEQLKKLEGALGGDTANRIKRQAVLHELAHFWRDQVQLFEPYIWYESEAARLENSEKSLTFAGHLLLDNLQQEGEENLRRWKAIQAKDLFERSLILDPKNDSSRVGLGACYLFGGISAAPMVGIRQIRDVADRDSTFIFAQMTLAKASLLSNQTQKAEERLRTVIRQAPTTLDALLLLAELREQAGDKQEALTLYKKCLGLTELTELKKALEERIQSLSNETN